ncbi:flagellar biosynthesis pathway, component FliR [Terriglobus roseus DSM 18391]|uniref:Flagellar biosynthesis pathway, component FliR n=1 Tax=Terriglobus roseus (strain DSM 18391 / NRRL B-41598 / KBS 63) TaxID=926566 RepID=I3ZFW4_TERRK|nr:flagellar biosynthetic protein FliR [Terriglobus roseus]AFL88132.1 flagellar biosynthesis pathway, component FliR [Terriglobus roseus DSM 18391]
MAIEAVPQSGLQDLLSAGLLVMLRLGSALVSMPIFNSPAIPVRVRSVFVLILAAVLTPVAAYLPGTELHLTAMALLGEVAVGLCFGLTLAFLNEAVLFAASMMSSAFSFSLANLMDPNSMVETEVLGTVLSWFGVLVLLSAGLHRTMLAVLMRTLVTVPLGHAPIATRSATTLANMASGIFFSGLQLAAPVVAAAFLVEVSVGIVGRMAPALPAQIASVPIKTLVSYTVLIGALAVWPGWMEHRFVALLDAAQKGMHA